MHILRLKLFKWIRRNLFCLRTLSILLMGSFWWRIRRCIICLNRILTAGRIVLAAVCWITLFWTIHWSVRHMRAYLFRPNSERVWLIVKYNYFSCGYDKLADKLIYWMTSVSFEIELKSKTLTQQLGNVSRI